ncbi:MAG: hypothetical protein ABEJ30_03820 [Halorientalis sp.]
MSERTMTRRRLLVAGGSMLLAGCGGQQDPSENRFIETRTEATRQGQDRQTRANGTASGARGSNGTATDTPSGRPTERPTEPPTEPQADTDTPTETPRETPRTDTRPDSARESFARARTMLSEAFDAFVATAADASILAVDSSHVNFNPSAVHRYADNAREYIDHAERLAGDQRTIAELRGAASYIDRLATVQSVVVGVYEQVSTAIDALSREDFSAADGPITFLDRDVRQARDEVATLREETDPSDVDPFGEITPVAYRAKFEQFLGELDVLERLDGPLRHASEGLRPMSQGTEAVIHSQWESAVRYYYRVNRDFIEMQRDLGGMSGPAGAGLMVDRLREIADTMVRLSEALIEATDEALRQNTNSADLGEARSIASSSEFAASLPSMDRLLGRIEAPTTTEDGMPYPYDFF